MGNRLTHACIALVVLTAACGCVWGQGPETGYPGTPTCFRIGAAPFDYVWDSQFASNLGAHGEQYLFFDLCNAGGFADDLAASGRLVYTGTDWDEYAFGNISGTKWTRPFFDTLATGTTLSAAFDAAESAVGGFNSPLQADPSGLGANTLDHTQGSVAFLFSFEDYMIGTQANVDRVYNTLRSLGWPKNSINTYHGADATYAALDTIYAATNAPSMDGKKIVVYISGHGFGTDAVTSTHGFGRYIYTVTPCRDRSWDPDNKGRYGVTEFRVETQDPDAARYVWLDKPEGWNVEVVGGASPYVRWWTDDAANALPSGEATTFTFAHPGQPYAAEWSTWVSGTSTGGGTFSDWSSDAGRDGEGGFVYESPTNWPAVANYAGDGGIYAPLNTPTAVRVAPLAAKATDGVVSLTWGVECVGDVVGYHILRGRSAAGPFVRLNEGLIPAQGHSSSTTAYSWVDTRVEEGTYIYRVEQILVDGSKVFGQPVAADVTPTPRVAPGAQPTVVR